jgi:predicted RNase H-like HicB family nuclease
MDQGRRLALTAVFLRNNSGYTGYVVELPGVNSHGRSIDQAREALQTLVALVFDEERRSLAETLGGKEVQREAFFLAAD